jgi:AraC-like DNA-binding protein
MDEQKAGDLRLVSDLRSHIEAFGARHAATRSRTDPAGMARLEDALGRMKTALRSNVYSAFRQTDFELHSAIIRLARVPMLFKCWLPVWEGLLAFHSSSFEECWPDLRVLAQEHEHLVQDIRCGDADAAEETTRSHIEAVWYRLDRDASGRGGNDPLQRAIAAIAFNLAGTISLKDVAAHVASASPGHLSHLFRKHHGVGFQQYVQRLRLEKAARLLSNTALPIGTIAVRVGYPDFSRFGQHFKRRYGLTPRAYRKREAP